MNKKNFYFRISEWESGEKSHSGRENTPNACKLHEIPGKRKFHGIHERFTGTRGSVYEEFLAANQRKYLLYDILLHILNNFLNF